MDGGFASDGTGYDEYQLKSLGLRSTRLHFSHSATLRTFPLSKMVFIFTSPPQGQ
jgi:hypothetical protein